MQANRVLMPRLGSHHTENRKRQGFGPDFLESLARGLKVISGFNSAIGQVTLSELSKRVYLPRATVRRALLTMMKLGYVDSDQRVFWLTPKILELASVYLTANRVPAIFQPLCEQLCKELRNVFPLPSYLATMQSY